MSAVRTAPGELRVDATERPLAVDGTPTFSWRLETGSDRRGASQTAYRLLVSRSEDAIEQGIGDVWDSGWIESERSTGVAYDGQPLVADETYYWTVRLRDETGSETPYAAPAEFRTAPRSLEGEWIAYQPGPGDSNGYRSRWRRPGEGATEWVQVDLGERRAVERVELHPADPSDGPETPDGTTVSGLFGSSNGRRAAQGAAGFGFPRGFRVEVADDPSFDDAVLVAERTEVENPGTDPVSVVSDASTGPGAETGAGVVGRYVRVTATDRYRVDPAASSEKLEYLREERSKWEAFALAALVVRDDEGADLATGRPVEASSSVETATWGRDHLTNGRLESGPASSSPQLRTTLSLSKPVERATARVAVGGYGELHVNGETVGEEVLGDWTAFDERVLYATYDVTDALAAGENTVGLWLGRGWFDKNVGEWTGFGSPRAKLDLLVEYADGTTRRLTSGPAWTARPSPIVENDLFDGERYDATREADGWASPGFDDREWESAAVVPGPGGDPTPRRVEPMRVVDELEPETIREREDGTIVDFGQNATGWLALEVRDATRGDEVTIRHAEALDDEGDLSTIDLRSADATDTYVARGDDRETYEPRFTYHGFRYAKISGYPGDLRAEDVAMKVVHTAMDRAGSFDCSDDDVARIQRCAEWGLLSNTHSVPTDCPQRDERMGWTGDGHLAARALQYNYDARRFHAKWLDDHADAQSRHGYLPATIPFSYGSVPADPTWTTTQVLLPWYLYRHYGDRGALAANFERMRRYVDYWHSIAEDGIVSAEYGDYGDWLAFENTSDEDDRRGLPYDLFNTAAHYRTTSLVADAAAELGHGAVATELRERADRIAAAFNDRYLDPTAGSYRPATQAAQALPLYLGIVPDEHEETVLDTLVGYVHEAGDELRTGFLGTRPLLFALADNGYAGLAYSVITNSDQPGWGYMVRNGATTMWERWDSDEQIGSGMNSLNHSPYTLVSEWFYEVLAGIEPRLSDRHLEIEPRFVAALDRVEGSLETPNGIVRVEWERVGDGIDLTVAVPWNTTATIRVPNDDFGRLSEGGARIRTERDGSQIDGIETVDRLNGTVVLEVASGRYEFRLEHR